jgi:hypothetical protein
MQEITKDEITLKEIILTIASWVKFYFSYWKLLFVIGISGASIGLLYSYMDKPEYTANLTFALEDKAGGGGLMSIASQFGFDLGSGEGGAFTGDNIMELLKSRYLIEEALLTNVTFNGKQQLLINRFIEFNKLRKNWDNDPELKSLQFITNVRNGFTRNQDSVLGIISAGIINSSLKVSKSDKKLNIVSVSVKSRDELFAKYFCEALMLKVTEFYLQTKTGKSKSNIQLLERRVDSVRIELDRAMYGRAQLGDQNTGLIRQKAAVPKLKQEMRVQMLGTMYGELIKNLEFSKLALMREEPLIQIIDKPILPLKVKKTGKTKGVLIGGILFGLLGIIYLTTRKLYEDIMLNSNLEHNN